MLVGLEKITPAIFYEKNEKDGFYYAKSHIDINISITYIIETPTKQPDYRSSDDPLINIILNYKQSNDFKNVDNEVYYIPNNFEDRSDFLIERYNNRQGNCTLRVAAFVHFINTFHPDLKTRIRAVDINNNHQSIEFLKDSWFPFDLGGSDNASLTHETDETPTTDLISTPSQESVKDKLTDFSNTIKNILFSNNTSNSIPTYIPTNKISVDSQLNNMKSILLPYINPITISNEIELIQKTLNDAYQKILIISNNIFEHAIYLMHMAKEQHLLPIYIEHPSNLNIINEISINWSGIATVQTSNSIQDFLSHHAPNKVIIINGADT